MPRLLSLTMLSVLLLATLVRADPHEHNVRRHHKFALRAPAEPRAAEPRADLERRDAYTNTRFTFYDDGLGACGVWNTSSDFIVALNSQMFGNNYPSPYCFDWITLQVGSITHYAQIVDECPGCPGWPPALDLSRGLFDVFADESVGVLYGTWWFNDAPPAPTTTQAPSTPTPTTTWTPPPTTSTTSTSVWVAPTTTSSSTTDTWSSSSSSSSSSSQTHSSWSSASSSASATTAWSASSSASASVVPTTPDALQALYQSFMDISELTIAGAVANDN